MAQEAMNSLFDLFVHDLKDTLDAEHQITMALPKMIDAASSPTVKSKFEQHLKETKGQIERLERIFSMLGVEPEREPCAGMAGLIKEGEKVISMPGEASVKDAALIASAQKVEHYEMSAYGTLRTFARTLGRNDVADLIATTLSEEKKTDALLTQVAEQSINKKAA